MTSTTHQEPKGSWLGATLLVAGTCIGGGILALPVITASIGFLPSAVTMLLAWAFMTITGLLFLEATLWMPTGAHVLTITSRLLGGFGKGFSWVIFLFVSLASIVAYIAAGAELTQLLIKRAFDVDISSWPSSLLFTFIFGAFLAFGKTILGRANAILCFGMIASYLLLVLLGISYVNPSFLIERSWVNSPFALPILLTTFSFPGVVPSLVPYLKRDVKKLKWAIVAGTTLACIMYLVWQTLILGSVPVWEENGLYDAWQKGQAATISYSSTIQNAKVVLIADFFAFFAIVTSFLGMTMALFDFLKDALKWNNRYVLLAIVLIPSVIFAVLCPRVFLVALQISGGVGDTTLNGLIPVIMIYIGRYRMKLNKEASYEVFGGKRLLVGLAIFSLFVMLMEVLERSGYYVPFSGMTF